MKSPTLNQHAILMLIYAMSPSGRIKKGEFLAQVERELNSLAPDMAFVNGDTIVAVAGHIEGVANICDLPYNPPDGQWYRVEIHPIKNIGNGVSVQSDSSPTPLDPDYFSVYLAFIDGGEVMRVADVATMDQAQALKTLLQFVGKTMAINASMK